MTRTYSEHEKNELREYRTWELMQRECWDCHEERRVFETDDGRLLCEVCIETEPLKKKICTLEAENAELRMLRGVDKDVIGTLKWANKTLELVIQSKNAMLETENELKDRR